MTKPRIRVTTDGRIGWPLIVQYEMLDGPDKGRLRTCPPTVEADLDPKSVGAPSIKEMIAGRVRGWEGRQRRGDPYRTVVHDRAAYDAMVRSREICSPRHTGAGRAVDNRAAPGA